MSKTAFLVEKEKLQVVQERIFNAPREKIWEVTGDPEQIPNWWGPSNLTTEVEKYETKVGGKWRFIHRDDKGNEFAFNGEFLEIDPPSKVVQTFNYEGIPGEHTIIETTTLEDLGDGQTRMKTVSQFANIEDLEGMVNSGMEGGATESWERLAAIVEKA
jgi:uncharacterized protein YndB with AHSA1/START domain